jgi:hypothetical protein
VSKKSPAEWNRSNMKIANFLYKKNNYNDGDGRRDFDGSNDRNNDDNYIDLSTNTQNSSGIYE